MPFIIKFSYLGENQKIFEKNLKDFELDVLKRVTFKALSGKK